MSAKYIRPHRERGTKTKVLVIFAYEDLIIGHRQNLERPEATTGKNVGFTSCSPKLRR